jgi:hypothetical protein
LVQEQGWLRSPELGHVRALASVRSALCLAFVAGLTAAHPDAGTFLLSDATQEAAFWVFALCFLWLASAAHDRPFARAAEHSEALGIGTAGELPGA